MPITVHFATNRVVTGAAEDWRSYGNGMGGPGPADIVYATAFVNETSLTADTQGAITRIQDVSRGGFSDQAIGDLQDGGRNVLVFIHGFDNSFEAAITRAAFNRDWFAASRLEEADTSVVAFCWPSLGKLLTLPVLWGPYKSDQVMAGRSALHLMSFLANLQPIIEAARAEGRRVFLVAHSMGHWALQAALDAWFHAGNGDAVLFDEAFLAAADEVYDSFDYPLLGRLSGLGRLAAHISILFSNADLILSVSAALNGVRRLGQEGPHARFDTGRFPKAKFSMVDCGGFRDYTFDPASSHQYYRRSLAVRALITGTMARSRIA